jgi:hypothetical protein
MLLRFGEDLLPFLNKVIYHAFCPPKSLMGGESGVVGAQGTGTTDTCRTVPERPCKQDAG